MFSKINAGDKVFVDGQEVEVTRVSNARFWVQVGDEIVKFIKTSGKEYGSQATRKATKEAEPVAEPVAEAVAEAVAEPEAVAVAVEAQAEAPKPKRTRKAKAAQVAPVAEVVEEAAAPTE